MSRQVIKIGQGNVIWWADFKHTKEADEIRRLFGTTTIPTPFGVGMDPAWVLAEIRRLNPGIDVEVE